jgi:hypothetical protein
VKFSSRAASCVRVFDKHVEALVFVEISGLGEQSSGQGRPAAMGDFWAVCELQKVNYTIAI